MIPNVVQRDCPQCNHNIHYATKYECKRAERNQSVCSKCRYKNVGSRNKANAKLSQEMKSDIVALLQTKMTYNEIKNKLGLDVTNSCLTKIAKENNLQRNFPKKLDFVNDSEARCSRCRKIKPLQRFKTTRYHKTDVKVGYLSFCRNCYNLQSQNKINGNKLLRFKQITSRIKKRSKTKNIPFDLSASYLLQLYEKQNGQCFYTGETMILKSTGQAKRLSVSVDRLEPEIGYVEHNVVLCCYIINRVKCDLSLNELAKWIPQWYQKIKKQSTNSL